MHAANDRPEFAPPPEPALVRAFALAVLAHLLLLLALTLGLRWQRETPNTVAEAELWSSLPQEAAPKPVPAPPPPPPPPPPKPVVKAPPPPPVPKVDINLEREKQRKLQEQKRQAELQREQEEQRRKLEAQKKREQELAQKKLEQQKLAKLEEQKRRDEEKRKQEEKRKEEEKKREQQEKLAKEQREKLRKDQMARMQALAGATGSPDATGRAQHSAGPSASWAGKVQARVRPKIVFTDTVSGNPEAEIEVRTSPDGTIVGKRVVRSSGVKSWDEAVLRALDKTESLPRDVDGRVPSPVIIGFRPKG